MVLAVVRGNGYSGYLCYTNSAPIQQDTVELEYVLFKIMLVVF